MSAKLIIIRGPSASGKSTIAKALFKKSIRKVCLIEQDYYRFMFRPNEEGGRAHSTTIHTLIKDNVRTALRDGYDVILEGILSAKSYTDDITEIIEEHPTDNYMFYLDVSLDETLRRLEARPTRNTATYTEGDLRTFYHEYDAMYTDEHVITERLTADEALAYIIDTTDM